MNEIEKFELDVFIKGELIDLCIPNASFAKESTWYSWFNNQRVTRFLYQGGFPNTPEQQEAFFNQVSSSSRLVLIISDKQRYIGTISLSIIDLNNKTADLAIVVGENSRKSKYPDLVALEAVFRIVEHGFNGLGLERISAGQHVLLGSWQQRMELAGFKLEGIKRKGFRKGHEREDAYMISVLYEDYLRLKEKRKKYWDRASKMNDRIDRLPMTPLNLELYSYFETKAEEYYEGLFDL